MKFVILALLPFLISCVSKSIDQTISKLQYERVFQFRPGTTTEADVVSAVGTPSTRVDKNGYYILSYSAPQTGFQRLSLNFSSLNNKLSSLLWIPGEGESKISLDGARAGFKEAIFEVSNENSSSPHAISKITLYEDKRMGITIRYNPSSDLVEAIAKYDINYRDPAAIEKKIQIPYTFADELKTSK